MKKIVFAFLIFLAPALQAAVTGVDCIPTFRSNGSVAELEFLVHTDNYGDISIVIKSVDADLTLNGSGDLVNKAAVKAALKAKFLARVAAIVADKNARATADALYTTRKAKILLPVSGSDLQ